MTIENSEEDLKSYRELRDLAVREVVKLCIDGCSSEEALLGALDKVLSHPFATCLGKEPVEDRSLERNELEKGEL